LKTGQSATIEPSPPTRASPSVSDTTLLLPIRFRTLSVFDGTPPGKSGTLRSIHPVDSALPVGEVHSMFKVSDSVCSTHGQDGAIVLDVQQGQMFNLNLVGSRILELLESGCSEGEIANVVSCEFNADIGVVRNDVKEFMETLETYKLLKASSAEQGRNGGTRC
jgi:hypothetical protein